MIDHGPEPITRDEVIAIIKDAHAKDIRPAMAYRNFNDVDLTGLTLDNAILCGSVFVDTVFFGTSLVGAQMHGCCISTTVDHCDFSNVVLWGADLTEATVTNSLFKETELTAATLNDVVFDNVKAQESLWGQVQCKNTTLRNTDLMWADMYDLVGHATLDKATEATLETCK